MLLSILLLLRIAFDVIFSCLQSINLLLAIAESKQDVVAILLPPLIKLGLPRSLVDLLSVEISKLTPEERLPERSGLFLSWDGLF